MSKFKDLLTKERLPKGSKANIVTELVSGFIILLFFLGGVVYYIINLDYKYLLICIGGIFFGIGAIIYNLRILNQHKKYQKNTNFTKAYDLFLVDYYNNRMKDKLRNYEVNDSLDISKKLGKKEVSINVKLDIFTIFVIINTKDIDLSIDYDLDFFENLQLVYEDTNDQEFSCDYFEDHVEIYKTITYKKEDNINELYYKIASFILERSEFLKNYESKFKKSFDEINKIKI